jgi:hypothetical protein
MELLEVKLSYILTTPGQTTILARYYRLDPEGNVGRDADGKEEKHPRRELVEERQIKVRSVLDRRQVTETANALLAEVAERAEMPAEEDSYVRAA